MTTRAFDVRVVSFQAGHSIVSIVGTASACGLFRYIVAVPVAISTAFCAHSPHGLDPIDICIGICLTQATVNMVRAAFLVLDTACHINQRFYSFQP